MKTFLILGASPVPGREVLLKFARRPADTQFAYLLAHIRQCAPCFDELKDCGECNVAEILPPRRWTVGSTPSLASKIVKSVG
jgi:hypothetical protein